MKNLFPAILLTISWAGGAYAQTAMTITSTEVNNIILGSYRPTDYQASTIITNPAIVSAGLVHDVSADSLKAYLFALNGFQNRNTFSDTSSSTFGIGAARRWVYNKFLQYSAANESRLR